MEKHYWIKPPALKNLEDLSIDEALEVIRNLQRYIDDSLQRRDTFYDNLLLMKKESDEKLNKLRKEFNERMRDHCDQDHEKRDERREESQEPEDQGNTTEEREEQVEEDGEGNAAKKASDLKSAFLTEVNLTLGSTGRQKESPDVCRNVPNRNANIMKIRALERELQESKKEVKELRKKYELARAAKKFGKGQGKQKTEEEYIDEKKKVDEIKELLVEIEVMKEKEKEMLKQMNIMRDAIKDYGVKYDLKCQELDNMRDAIKDYGVKYDLKCQELDNLRKARECWRTPDAKAKELEEDLKKLKLSDEELRKKLAELRGQVEEKQEEIDKLKEQLQVCREERDSQERSCEDTMVLLKDLQEEVQKLEATKRVTNERMRQMGGHVRVSTTTQTYPSTADAATNTENTIYNVCGRSLKQEETQDERFLRSVLGKDFQNKKGLKSMAQGAELRISAQKTECPTAAADSNSDFVSGKIWTEDDEEYFRNIRAMEDSLEIFRPDSAALNENGDKLFSSEDESLKMNDLMYSDESEDHLKLPQLSSMDTRKKLNRMENRDARSSIDVKLPNIPVYGNRAVADHHEDGRNRKGNNRKEQIPSKIGVLMKEGDDSVWKPITDGEISKVSPQRSSSSPVFTSPLKQIFGKSQSEVDNMGKDMKLRAATKKKNDRSKKEFMLTPSDKVTD